MGSKWRKAKLALGLHTCVYVPRTIDEEEDAASEKASDAALLSAMTTPDRAPAVSPGFRFPRTGSRSTSSKKTCSICLASMKRGDGHAIFTAECSHAFHFQCIASNVKHGNQICPICRATWKEVPFQIPNLTPPLVGARINPVDWDPNNALMTVVRRLPSSRSENRPFSQAPEPGIFNDDESLGHQSELTEKSPNNKETPDNNSSRMIEIRTYSEASSVPRSKTQKNFNVLIHLKADVRVSGQNLNRTEVNALPITNAPRAPVDLVTVLDVSGSMSGTKLALLKQAMGFVIQNLGSSDRLSVIAFSSTARRLFPLRRMSDSGRQQALLAVNSLVANGGTNIAEGLRKGAKILQDRREKNPVVNIILLSDGQDTYTICGSSSRKKTPNYKSLLPLSIHGGDNRGFQVPVHAFGFGTDHDASSMHSISEISGGTFSFIETEGLIQDAFAQCIGGLLSVVVLELQVGVECLHPEISLGSLKAGSYPTHLMADGRTGSIDAGDLYADEERDFLALLNIPEENSGKQTPLLKVRCTYKDPLTKKTITLESEVVRIDRPEIAGQEVISIEVDRQRNRLHAAEAMAEARAAAEQGDLSGAIALLENCRVVLSNTASGKSHDRLCIALDAELREMQDRMVSRHVYEASGRAYILSGLSSHSWQRATARGDSTADSSLVQSYQTPSMAEMLTRSQATLLSSPSTQRLIQPVWSSRPKPSKGLRGG